jgi:hypothetical protein
MSEHSRVRLERLLARLKHALTEALQQRAPESLIDRLALSSGMLRALFDDR